MSKRTLPNVSRAWRIRADGLGVPGRLMDGSTDGTGALADELAAQNPGVRRCTAKTAGFPAARNTGLAAAKGEWVLFLDGDDRMAPGLLEGLRRSLAEEPGFDWYIGPVSAPSARGMSRTSRRLVFAPGAGRRGLCGPVIALYAAGHWSVWKYCLRRGFFARTRPAIPGGRALGRGCRLRS